MSKLEKAMAAYREKFGKNYPMCITTLKSDSEIIADIENCIETGTEAKRPHYEPGCIY